MDIKVFEEKRLTSPQSFFIDVDDCVNHTCANGASCVDGYNNYSCNCLPRYTGEHCETGRCAATDFFWVVFVLLFFLLQL